MSRSGKKFHGESSSFFKEKEVRSVNYDYPPSALQTPETPSKENVELSLEVEIADSLKRLLTSPQNCTSRLLDVTIIRPNETAAASKVETNTVAFGKNEIKDLITIIEKQKKEKKKRIDEHKQKLYQKIQAHEKTYNYRPTSPPQQLRVRSEIGRPKSPKTVRINQNPQYIEDQPYSKRKDICVKSAPPNLTLQRDKHNFDLRCLKGELKKGSAKIDYTSKLKKYKDIEGRLLELCAASKSKYSTARSMCSEETVPTGDSNYYTPSTITNYVEPHSQQIYATQRTTFDDLRNKFKCTNPNKTGKPDEPCVCQHCGMIGLLIDSQKGPILPATTKSTSPWMPSTDTPVQTESKSSDRKGTWRDGLLGLKGVGKYQTSHNHECVIKQINVRLKSLEERVSIQEETSVTRDYFKNIMNKLLQSYKSSVGGEHTSKPAIKRDTSIQCGKGEVDENNSYNKRFYKNEQVTSHNKSKYERKRNSYIVHPLLLSQGHSSEILDIGSILESEVSCDAHSKGDCKIGKIDEADELINAPADEFSLKEKNSESLWRWGEEVIKPGFDLKTKIVSLLEEKLKGFKTPKKKMTKENDVSVQVELINEAPKVCEVHNKPEGTKRRKDRISSESTVYKEECKTTGINIVPEKKYQIQRGIIPSRQNTPANSSQKVNAHYPIDVKKALDDTTFRRNIEASKEWSKQCERIRKEHFESGDTTSSGKYHVEKKNRHKYSRSDLNLKRTKIKEFKKLESKTYVSSIKTTPTEEQDMESSYQLKHGKHCKVLERKETFTLERKKSNLNSKTVQVAYVNPKASVWKDETFSSDSRSSKMKKAKSRDKAKDKRKLKPKQSMTGKLQYLQNLAKSKNVNEELIWENIVKQVKSHSNKSKDETVKIKIPTEVLYRLQNEDVGVTEIEMTMADLQNIIGKSKPKKSSSGASVNTTGLVDNRKKLQELHKQIGAMLTKNRPKFGL